MRRAPKGAGHGAEDVPWASFADALTGLLFVFILLTVMFVFAAQQAKDAADKERESLTAADQRARAMVDRGHPRSFVSCLQGEVPAAVRLIPGHGADASALSIVIGWFAPADAELQGLACELTQSVGSCLVSVLERPAQTGEGQAAPILRDGDTLRVFVEGHTDSEPMKPGEKYPSNWELSGARAAAVVRALTVNPGPGPKPKCVVDERLVNSVQQAMNGTNTSASEQNVPAKLELIAVGRADQAPARAVVCAKVGNGGPSNTGSVAGKDNVCECMKIESSAERLSCEQLALRPLEGDTHQRRLIAWANSDKDRKLSMRHVDLRFEVRPALEEVPSGR